MSKHVELKDFDPNKEALWMTFISYRRPQVKLHTNRAAALGALTSRRFSSAQCALYELVSGAWIEHARQIARDHNYICDQCGGSVLTQVPLALGNPLPCGLWDHSYWHWTKDSRGRVTDPPRLLYMCEPCVFGP